MFLIDILDQGGSFFNDSFPELLPDPVDNILIDILAFLEEIVNVHLLLLFRSVAEGLFDYVVEDLLVAWDLHFVVLLGVVENAGIVRLLEGVHLVLKARDSTQILLYFLISLLEQLSL